MSDKPKAVVRYHRDTGAKITTSEANAERLGSEWLKTKPRGSASAKVDKAEVVITPEADEPDDVEDEDQDEDVDDVESDDESDEGDSEEIVADDKPISAPAPAKKPAARKAAAK